MRQVLLLSLLIFTANQLWAQPANDNWQNAIEIQIAEDGFAFDTFQAPFVSMRNATTDLNETFHTVIKTLALDQKSVWYKFSLPTSRTVKISLIQKDTIIQPLDVGMSLVESVGSYPNINTYNESKVPTIGQMGSIKQVVQAGEYFVQVVGRKSVVDSIGIKLSISKVNTLGNSIQNPFYIGSNKDIYYNLLELDSLAETAPFHLTNITKSAYAVFNTYGNYDRIRIQFNPKNIAAVFYEKGIGNDPSKWKIIRITSINSVSQEWNFSCDALKRDTAYVIKFIGTKSGYVSSLRMDKFGNGQSKGTDPISDLQHISLKTAKGNQQSTYSQNYACSNNNALKICPSFKQHLNDTVSMPYKSFKNGVIHYDTTHVPISYSGGWWLGFEAKAQMKISSIVANQKYLVFKGQAKNNICELGAPIDIIDKCIFKGEKYTFLILNSPNIYSNGDTLIDYAYGSTFDFNIEYRNYISSQKTGVFYKKEFAQSLGEIEHDITEQYSVFPIKPDWLGGHPRAYQFGDDKMQGEFSFVSFKLKKSAYIAFNYKSLPNSTVNNYYLAGYRIYRLSSSDIDSEAVLYEIQNRLSTTEANYTKDICPPGNYLIVFNTPEKIVKSCFDMVSHYANGSVLLRTSVPADPTKSKCEHKHYAAKLAYKINNLEPLKTSYVKEGSNELGVYSIISFCTSDAVPNLNNPLMYNYQVHKKKIKGFIYYVFKIDETLNIRISFNTKFQVLKGDISKDSSIAKLANVLYEFGDDYRECTLGKGYYTIIAAENGENVWGSIKVQKTGYTINNHSKFAQDAGLLNKGNPTAQISGIIACNTTAINSRLADTWHTFRLNQPGKLYFPYIKGIGVYKATRGADLPFDEVRKRNLVDSTWQNLAYVRYTLKDSLFFIKKDFEMERFYIQIEASSELYFEYKEHLTFVFDSLSTTLGDSCENAIEYTLDGVDKVKLSANINIHTIGEGPFETAASNPILNKYENFKTTWFKVTTQNSKGLQLLLSSQRFSNAREYRYYIGSCHALTPSAVINQQIASNLEISLDCIDDGAYYVQVFNAEYGTENDKIDLDIETRAGNGPCKLIDLNKVIANFGAKGGCPNTAVQFTNKSTWGDSMMYIWTYGDGIVDTAISPLHQYPFTSQLDTYLVSLVAFNKINNRSDTFSKRVVVGTLVQGIIGDTIACSPSIFTAKNTNEMLLYTWYSKQTNNSIRYLSNSRKLTYYSAIAQEYIYLEQKIANCAQLDSMKIYSAIRFNYFPNGELICPGDKGVLFHKPISRTDFVLKDYQGFELDSIEIMEPDNGKVELFAYLNGKLCFDNYYILPREFKKPLSIKDPVCEGDKIAYIDNNSWLVDDEQGLYNQSYYFNPNQSTYYYKYMALDSSCGWIYDTVIIDSYIAKPVAIKDTILCDGASITINLDSLDLKGYAWSDGYRSVKRTIDKLGLYMLNYTYKSCYFNDTAVITTATGKELNLNDQQLCFQDEEVNLNITDYDSLYWSNGSNDTEQIFSNEGTYWLQAFKNGCVVSDTFTLTNYCEPKLFIPNAFSPNGDTDNPVFIAKGDKVQKFQMRIYNRDGALIFYTDNINEGWDGRIKNLDAPMASYFYVVEYSTEQGDFVKSGNLLLLR